MHPIYGRVCACARFGAGGHTFNFARPITKSDMHHSEINSQQQRAHVLFVMSRSNSPERVCGGEVVGEERRRSARKMSPAVVAGSSYLPSELPVNDNPWCTALPCLSHVYQLSLRRVSLSLSLSGVLCCSPYSGRVLCFRLGRFREISCVRQTQMAAETSVTVECRCIFFGTSHLARLCIFNHVYNPSLF